MLCFNEDECACPKCRETRWLRSYLARKQAERRKRDRFVGWIFSGLLLLFVGVIWYALEALR